MKNIFLLVLFFMSAKICFADSWTTPTAIDINSSYFDHMMPSINHNETKLFFSSDSDGIANGPADIYYSLSTDSGWSEPIFMGNIVNDIISIELSPCIGYDDTTLYFVRSCITDSIWVTYFTNGDWLLPQPLDSAINNFQAGGPAINRNGQVLYFHSNRPGGYGGYDIWMSLKTGGKWQEPINMGPMVNTSVDEKEPSIAANDSDFVFWRTANDSDTCNIWYYKIGTSEPAECIFYGHYVSNPYYGSYWYQNPCISWDGQNIFINYIPFNTEELSYIRISDRETIVAVTNNNKAQKIALKLENSYPNPFENQTKINFQLSFSGQTNLSIYNNAGQLVKILVNDNKKAGHYQVVWDGLDENNCKAPKGVYFYKLTSANTQLIKKMVLIK